MSSGSTVSAKAVKPRKSQKTTVISRRWLSRIDSSPSETINSATVGYMRTFALFGRAASAAVARPYAWADVTGDVFEERRAATLSGLADTRLRFAVNLLGGEVGDREQFAARTRSTHVGASLSIVAPTGQYDSSKLINLGSNRWALKPEIGVYQPFGPWSFELAAGVWLFGDNNDFYGGVRREQDPIASLQTHVGYSFRPHLWATADWSYYRGGATRLNGVRKHDLQDSTRAGLAVSIPVTAKESLKLAWSDAVTTRIGADVTTYAITLQRAW